MDNETPTPDLNPSAPAKPGKAKPEPETEPIPTDPWKNESAGGLNEPVREIHHRYHDKPKGFSFGRLLFGGLLIIIGLAYLGDSLGWLTVNVDLGQLWPLLIVLLGLSILSRHGWVAWIVGALITLVILGGVAYVFFGGARLSREVITEPISIARETSAQAAKIEIESGAGRLSLRGGSDQLVSGTFESNVASLTKTSTLSGTEQLVSLEMRGQWRGFGTTRNTLALQLADDLPTEVSINSGAIDMQLDFTDVTMTQLDVDTGASSLDLDLGDRVDRADVTIKAGASSVNISLPRTVGVRLTVEAGLSSKDFEDFNKLSEGVYESEGYADAAKKIEIDLEVGVSSVDVNWR